MRLCITDNNDNDKYMCSRAQFNTSCSDMMMTF